jgi:hypothetical protein
MEEGELGVACGTHVYRIQLENMKETVCLEYLSTDVWIILKWTLEKQGGNGWTVFIWFRTGTSQWHILVHNAASYHSAKPDLWFRIRHWDNGRSF